tara:strand:+ start:853 stop:1065 length:213 start_codon:yes stop_codon:yes gene_type:complete
MVKDRGTADIEFDMDGNAFFMVDDVKYSLDEFIRADGEPSIGYMALSNTGGISANIDPSGEEVYFEFILA